MPAPVYFKYHAFLSYAHADVRWGKWLHGQLEGFRIDRDLAGRETSRGIVPKTLRPIFRDREDFSGGHSLTDATVSALDQSSALIVLCSMASATRPAVNEEVRLFRWRHSDRPVIPVIIDGIYPDNFPHALRFEIASDGSISDRPVTILGPDLREEADGRQLGLAKIVAGLIGVGPDDIYRRAERARRAATRLRNAVIAVLALLIVAFAGSGILSGKLWLSKVELLDATLAGFTHFVDAGVKSAANAMPLAQTRFFLEGAEGMLMSGGLTEDGRYLLISLSEGSSNSNRLYMANIGDPKKPDLTAPVKSVVETDGAEFSPIGNVGSVLYLRSDQQAPNRKVIAVDTLKPEPSGWKTIVPERKEAMESVALIGGRIVAEYLVDVQSRVSMFDLQGAGLGEIALPSTGVLAGLAGREDSPTIW